ncbi:hypothetical protein EDD22DRAFT_1052389 [Suillus occidentalis]|nr:hypothetical protein EDD22DRAFT_1052389 [Suillus occidentalis]
MAPTTRQYFCNCRRKCGGVPTEVTRSVYRTHEDYRIKMAAQNFRQDPHPPAAQPHTEPTSHSRSPEYIQSSPPPVQDRRFEPYQAPGHSRTPERIPSPNTFDPTVDEYYPDPPANNLRQPTVEDVKEDGPDNVVPRPLDADEEALLEDVYSNVKQEDLRTSLSFIISLQNASLNDAGTGLSEDAIKRLCNPLQQQLSLNDNRALRLAIRLYLELNHSDEDYIKACAAHMEYDGAGLDLEDFDTHKTKFFQQDPYKSSNDKHDALVPSPKSHIRTGSLYDDLEEFSRRGRSTSHKFDRFYPSDTSHSGNSFVDSSSSLSRHTSSMHLDFSHAYRQRSGASSYVHESTDHHEISMLKKDKYALEQKVDELQQQVVALKQQVISLEGKQEVSTSMYAQLLERITSLGNNTPTAPDSFNEMLKMAREADTLIPTYHKEDYEGVYYWNKDEWTKEFLGGCGVLKVKRVDGAGSALYLVDEDGIVASEAVQQKMRDRLHTLWPREQGDAGKRMIKQENFHEPSLSTAPAKPKRPQSLTISPSTRHPKKKKDDNLPNVEATASVGSTVLINALARQASLKYGRVAQGGVDLHDDSDGTQLSDAPAQTKQAVKIVNPLSGLFKPKDLEGANTLSSTAGLIPSPASASTTSMSSPTAKLVANMASTTMNDAIDDAIIPPTANGKQTFVQLLSDSFISAKDASARASVLPSTAIDSSSITNFDAVATKATKTLPKKKDPRAAKEASGRATSK